jgi:hypothetical protein
MSCYVIGCGEPLVRHAGNHQPLVFKHQRFGQVQACDGHGKGLPLVFKTVEVAVDSPGAYSCIQCRDVVNATVVCRHERFELRQELEASK